jgi:hypothetical protein
MQVDQAEAVMGDFLPAQWTRVGVCPAFDALERLHHAGLSSDGRHCFVASVDDDVYAVWDIAAGSWIWIDDGTDGDSPLPSLNEWADADMLDLDLPAIGGPYQLFGLFRPPTIVDHPAAGLHIELDGCARELLLRTRDGAIWQRLPYDARSGDWACASFSANGRMIAVLEPYAVTFFAPHGALP